MKKKRKLAVKRTISAEAMARIAGTVSPGHEGFLGSGYQLSEKTRLSRCADGSWTGRFVYVDPADPNFRVTNVVRGIVFT